MVFGFRVFDSRRVCLFCTFRLSGLFRFIVYFDCGRVSYRLDGKALGGSIFVFKEAGFFYIFVGR